MKITMIIAKTIWYIFIVSLTVYLTVQYSPAWLLLLLLIDIDFDIEIAHGENKD